MTPVTPSSVCDMQAFDEAVAAELPCVSVVPYNSYEICKWFAANVRERLRAALAERTQQEALPSGSDKDFWIKSRASILLAIEKAGFLLMSNKEGFFLHKSSAANSTAPMQPSVLQALLDHVEGETCRHETTHRGGAIWTICDDCDRKWADDEGGFVPYEDPPAVAAARAALVAPTQAPMQPSEPVRAALEGMQRFWGKYPEFVHAPAMLEQACEAVEAMNRALAAPTQAAGGEAVRETLIKELTAQASWVPSGPAGVMHRAAAFLTAAPSSQAAGGEAEAMRWLWEDQSAEEKAHYLNAARAAAPAAAVEQEEPVFHLRSYGDVTEAQLLELTKPRAAAVDLCKRCGGGGWVMMGYGESASADECPVCSERAAAAPEGLTDRIDTIIRDIAELEGSESGPESMVVTADELRVILERNLATPDAKRDAHYGGNSYEASMLRNLLARIHRDGGHYLDQHGLDKALEDADALVVQWLSSTDAKTAEARKALTAGQITRIWMHNGGDLARNRFQDFARAIEREHGIGDQP